MGDAARSPELPGLPPRDPSGHKGTFGTVCVIGGCAAPPRPMVGAPAFAALAALRTGCGLAMIAAPAPILVNALTIAPGATGLALPVGEDQVLDPSGCSEAISGVRSRVNCLVLGPGLGAGFPVEQLVMHLVATEGLPIVIDADGLNALAATPSFQLDLRAPCVLTPHPGEFGRLAAALSMDDLLSGTTECASESTNSDHDLGRARAAKAMAQRLGCVLLLKGARTVVSDGINCWSARCGNAALATAGSGDVLSGIVASLIAQFHGSPRRQPTSSVSGQPASATSLSLFECAQLAAHIHGKAADAWAALHGTAGLVAQDLCAMIPDELDRLRRAPG